MNTHMILQLVSILLPNRIEINGFNRKKKGDIPMMIARIEKAKMAEATETSMSALTTTKTVAVSRDSFVVPSSSSSWLTASLSSALC